MNRTVREILKSRNLVALAEYLRERLGLTVTNAHLSYIIEQATGVGGPEHDPWSESTWRMWLKGKATQPPQTTVSLKPGPIQVSGGVKELEAALIDASDTLLSTREFQFCEMAGANDLLCDYPEEVWHQIFPAFEAIGKLLREQFEARGGRKLLGRAPFASWLYARLVFLGIARVDEENDLGGYGISFVVKSKDRPIGILLLDADTDQVDVHLEAQTSTIIGSIRDQWIELLLEEIKNVARCELEVSGAEVNGTNSYGWTGNYFLGEANVR